MEREREREGEKYHMGKSGGRRKKSGGSNQVSIENSAPTGNGSNGGVDLDSSFFFFFEKSP